MKCSPEVHALARRVHKEELLEPQEFDTLTFEMDVILGSINEPSPEIGDLLTAEASSNIENAGTPEETGTSAHQHSSDFADTESDPQDNVNDGNKDAHYPAWGSSVLRFHWST